MRATERRGTVLRVSREQRRRVVIDIVQTTDTVRGQMAVGDGPAREFFGWIDLIDRLQSAAIADVNDTTPRSDIAGSS